MKTLVQTHILCVGVLLFTVNAQRIRAEEPELIVPSESPVFSVQWSDEQVSKFAYGDFRHNLNLKSQQREYKPARGDGLGVVTIASHHSQFLIGGFDGKASIFSRYRHNAKLGSSLQPLHDLVLDPTGEIVAFAQGKRFEAKYVSGNMAITGGEADSEITAIGWLDETALCTCDDKGNIQIWNATQIRNRVKGFSKGQQIAVVGGPEIDLVGSNIADTATFVTCGSDNVLRKWRRHAAAQESTNVASPIALSRNGEAAVWWQGSKIFIKTGDSQSEALFDFSDKPIKLAFHKANDKVTIAIQTKETVLKVLDKTGSELSTDTTTKKILDFAFNSNGDQLSLVDTENIFVRALDDGASKVEKLAPQTDVFSVQYVPGSNDRCVTVGSKNVRVWDTASTPITPLGDPLPFGVAASITCVDTANTDPSKPTELALGDKAGKFHLFQLDSTAAPPTLKNGKSFSIGSDLISQIRLDSDGRRVAVGASDTTHVFQVDFEQAFTTTLLENFNFSAAAVFTLSGDSLVSVMENKLVRDPLTGFAVRALSSKVHDLDVHKDGRIFAAQSSEIIAFPQELVGNATSNKLDDVSRISLAPDNATFVAAYKNSSGDHEIGVWMASDVRTPVAVLSSLIQVTSFGFAPDKNTFYAGLVEGDVVEIAFNEEESLLTPIDLLARNVTGDRVVAVVSVANEPVSAHANGDIIAWRRGFQLEESFVGHHGPINDAVLYGRMVATACGDGKVRIWKRGDARTSIVAHETAAYGVAYDPVVRRIITVGSDGFIREWPTENMTPGQKIGDPTISANLPSVGPFFCIDIHPARKYVVTGAGKGATRRSPYSVVIWNRALTTSTTIGETFENSIYDLGFSRDGKKLAAIDLKGNLKVWEFKDGMATFIAAKKVAEAAYDLSWHPVSNRLVIATDVGVYHYQPEP